MILDFSKVFLRGDIPTHLDSPETHIKYCKRIQREMGDSQKNHFEDLADKAASFALKRIADQIVFDRYLNR